jgi:hypothetical protein
MPVKLLLKLRGPFLGPTKVILSDFPKAAVKPSPFCQDIYLGKLSVFKGL